MHIPRYVVASLFCMGAMASSGGVGAQGYAIEEDGVAVYAPEHWRQWDVPGGTLEIGEAGRVRPAFVRRGINAAADADAFLAGDVATAGSDPGGAAYVLDEDPHTFWEPRQEDPLRRWWIQVDLGRLVCATKVVLRFAEEGRGDPFAQFKVLASDGRKAFEGGNLLGFRLIGRTTKTSVDQRVFEYEVQPTDRTDGRFTGGIIRYIQVVVTDSKGDQGEEVSEEVYQELASDERGAVVHHRRTALGWERPVDPATYELLDSERRGPIRYYRREIPRLAEIEVWSIGDDIGLGLRERGGHVEAPGHYNPMLAFDGDFTTHWATHYFPHKENNGGFLADLGAVFWVDEIRIINTLNVHKYTLPGYVIEGSDGSRASDGTLKWDRLTPESRKQNPDNALRFEDRFSLRKLRFVRFWSMDWEFGPGGGPFMNAWIDEFQVYGEGYVAEVTMTSDLIELGGARNLTNLTWEADVPSGTSLEIRTRTGDELQEVQHFFNASGTEVTELAYNRLPGFSRGEIRSEYVPGTGWSSWSPLYQQSGDRILSPSPRTYAMVQVRIVSDDPHTVPSIERIRIDFVPPLAKEILAEISPHRDVRPGVPQEFACVLIPSFLPTDSGFDEVLIQSPPGLRMDLLGVRLGSEKDFLENRTVDFMPEGDRFASPDGSQLQVMSDRSDSLWVRLPEIVRIGRGDWILIRFRSTVFLNGTQFSVQIGNSAMPGIWQRADSGDATYLTSGQGTTVLTPVTDRILDAVELVPNPFTPNGDGIHDEVEIRFVVLKVTADTPVEVQIHTLFGRLLRTLQEGRTSASGAYRIAWDGRDESGTLVPPGLYLCCVRVDPDDRSAEQRMVCRVVSCVY